MLKAISLWRPWSHLVALGLKREETRSWPTEHRGEIAIHVSRRDGGDYDGAPWGPLADAGDEGRVPENMRMARGAIIAVASLTACRRTESLIGLSDDERALGDFSPGRWAWRIEDALWLDEPVPCRGRQRIWTLDEETERKVREKNYPF